MKKIIKYISLFSILFPLNAHAFSLSCPEYSINYNNTFYCKLSEKVRRNYNSLKAILKDNDLIQCKIISMSEGLNVNNISDKIIDVSGHTQEQMIASIECKVTGKVSQDSISKLSVSNITYSTSEGQSIKAVDTYANINVKKYEAPTTSTTSGSNSSTNYTTTKNLLSQNNKPYLYTIYCPDFSINFSRFIYEYDVEVLNKVTSLYITATPVDSTSKVKIVGADNLKVGDNDVYIYVTDKNNNQLTYTLNVKRLEAGKDVYLKESDPTLFSMEVVGYNIAFKKDKYEYELPLGSDVKNLFVEARAMNDKASIKINYPEKIKDKSKIIITVTSEDKTNTKNYVITINKQSKQRNYLYLIIGIVVLILIVILIFLIKKIKSDRKKDKILGINSNKRTINRGEEFDINDVPDA